MAFLNLKRMGKVSLKVIGTAMIAVDPRGKKKYGFRIKGGVYGDLYKVQREESSRYGNASGLAFERTQMEYDGH